MDWLSFGPISTVESVVCIPCYGMAWIMVNLMLILTPGVEVVSGACCLAPVETARCGAHNSHGTWDFLLPPLFPFKAQRNMASEETSKETDKPETNSLFLIARRNMPETS